MADNYTGTDWQYRTKISTEVMKSLDEGMLQAAEKSDAAAASAAAAAESAAEAESGVQEAVTKATEAAESANEAAEKAEKAATDASDAAESASSAMEKAEEAEKSITEAVTQATEAVEAANTAVTQANEATTTANEAVTKAETAASNATEAAEKANEAAGSANEAATAANEATEKAQEATEGANEAVEKAEAANEKADSAVEAAQSAIETAQGVSDKVDESLADIEKAAENASQSATAANEAANTASSAASSANDSAEAAEEAATDAESAAQEAKDAWADAVHSVTVGETTTGEPGTNASVTNSGTNQDLILDFTIPKGEDGANSGCTVCAIEVPENGWEDTGEGSYVYEVKYADFIEDESFLDGTPITPFVFVPEEADPSESLNFKVFDILESCTSEAFTIRATEPVSFMGNAFLTKVPNIESGGYGEITFSRTMRRIAQNTEDIAEATKTANEAKEGLTNGSVTQIGTDTVGDEATPIYLDNGVPKVTTSAGGEGEKTCYYGTCDTAYSEDEKIVITDDGFILREGSRISVNFLNYNETIPSLNVNSTGAKNVVAYGTTPSGTWWSDDSIIEFVYNGENWVMVSENRGNNNNASGACSHAEGSNTAASGNSSHAEGYGVKASKDYSHAEGWYATASGDSSHAEGSSTSASGNNSHAEGYNNNASGASSHAEGSSTSASGNSSHAEGYGTTASGAYSHAAGNNAKASGNSSHAEGYGVKASTNYSHVSGYYTESGTIGETVIGQRNVVSEESGGASTTVGNAFVIGNGTGSSQLSNAFRVTKTGEVYALSEFNSSGADYAEYVKEWYDGNPDEEDRVGYFVTVIGGLLYKANPGDFIVGITSGAPSIIGNSDEDYLHRYERDEFNRVIFEDVAETTEEENENGEIVEVETGNVIANGRMKLAEDYDASLQPLYVQRANRPEWDAVGMVGVIAVRDDGTCEVDGLCKCGEGGIATKAVTREFDTFRVIERVTDSVIRVLMK